ncbi:MAG: class I SAM-dependent methyltransferase [Limisphaerales bacterium]
MSATAKMLVMEDIKPEYTPGFSPAILFNEPVDFDAAEQDDANEAIVDYYESSLNAADGVILHLGAGHGELMDALRQHGFSVMGCEPRPRPTRFARNRGFDACTLQDSSAEGLLHWVRRIGQKAQTIFFRHDWEHNLELQALLPRMAEVLREGGRVVALLPPPASGFPTEAHVSFLNELAVGCISSSRSFKMDSVDCDITHFMAFVLRKETLSGGAH